MKKFITRTFLCSILISLPIAGAYSQQDLAFFNFSENGQFVLGVYDASNRMTMKIVNHITNVSVAQGITTAIIQSDSYDANNKLVYSTNGPVTLQNGQVDYGNTSLTLPQIPMGMSNMSYKITGTGLRIPNNVALHQTLSDANSTGIFSLSGMELIRITSGLSNIKVESLCEEVSVPAGTFKCIKISSASELVIAGTTTRYNYISYYARGVGFVKSESSAGGAGYTQLLSTTASQSTSPCGEHTGNTGDTTNNNEHNDITVKLRQVDKRQLPVAGANYLLELDVQGNPAKIIETEFRLTGVSREMNNCLNDKQDENDVNPDLTFDDDPGSGYELVHSDNDMTARSRNPGMTSINVTCNDFGAYAKISARVKIRKDDGSVDDRIVYAKETNLEYVNIPYDLNNNHIADIWEEANNVIGKAINSDDENTIGQSKRGDGITLYEEYRGFYVINDSGRTEHIRTDPNKKEIFFIDEGNLFSKNHWKKASGIDSYKLKSGMVQADVSAMRRVALFNDRKVDFTNGTAPGMKFALKIISVSGTQDIVDPSTDTTLFCYHKSVNNMPRVPKSSLRIIIFSDRIKQSLSNTKDKFNMLLTNNPGQQDFMFSGNAFARNEMQSLINVINDEAKQKILIKYFTCLCAIQCAGDACGSNKHHLTSDGKFTGNKKCPMRYHLESGHISDIIKDFMEVIMELEVAGIMNTFFDNHTQWKFCGADEDNCMNLLNVNDLIP